MLLYTGAEVIKHGFGGIDHCLTPTTDRNMLAGSKTEKLL